MLEGSYINMTARGQAVGKPDIGLLYLYIEGKGDTLKRATAECDAIAQRVCEAIREADGAVGSIRLVDSFIGDLSGSHEFSLRDEPRTAKMIHVKKLFVTLPADEEMARRVADVGLLSGAKVTSSVKSDWIRQAHSAILYTASDYDAIRMEAIECAIERAREDAEVTAAALGKRCGEARSFVDVMLADEMPPRRFDGDNDPPFHWSRMTESPIELKVNARVRLQFDLLDAV